MAEVVHYKRTFVPGSSNVSGGPGGPYSNTVDFSNLFFRDSLLSPASGSSLWETCPLAVAVSDPSVLTVVDLNFCDVTPASNTIPGWTFTQATAGAVTLDAAHGLKLDAGAATANQGVNFQMARSAFQLAANKAIWLEGSFLFTALTSLKIQFLFGLVVPKTAIIAGGAIGTDDKIAFDGVTTAGVIATDATASATTTNGVGLTLANSTTYKLGLYATANLAKFYVNGQPVSQCTTNIPTSALAPSIVVQANATVEPIVFCQWLRCVGVN